MAAFKGHCTFGFWKGAMIIDTNGKNANIQSEAMGQFGRITALSDLPQKKVLLGYIKQAVKLNEEGIKLPSKPKPKKRKELKIPADFMAALRKQKKAFQTFENFSPSHKQEYVEWIVEAKGEETRARRMKSAIAWMAEGKVRNWKYIRR